MRPPWASMIWREIESPRPGVLAKALLRPVGVETLENAFEGAVGNSGAVVVDDDLEAVDLLAARPHGPLRPQQSPARRRRASKTTGALSIRLLNTWPRRESLPRTRQRLRGASYGEERMVS